MAIILDILIILALCGALWVGWNRSLAASLLGSITHCISVAAALLIARAILPLLSLFQLLESLLELFFSEEIINLLRPHIMPIEETAVFIVTALLLYALCQSFLYCFAKNHPWPKGWKIPLWLEPAGSALVTGFTMYTSLLLGIGVAGFISLNALEASTVAHGLVKETAISTWAAQRHGYIQEAVLAVGRYNLQDFVPGSAQPELNLDYWAALVKDHPERLQEVREILSEMFPESEEKLELFFADLYQP